MALTSLVWMLAACGLSERLEAGRSRPVEDAPTVVARGEGYALRVPEGSRVVLSETGLAVDPPGGLWWFDVRALPMGPNPVDPARLADAWAQERCFPIRWDLPATPTPESWTVGGFCTISERDHWVVVSVEDRADAAGGEGRRLLTGLIADRYRVPYEDVWVAFVGTALTAVGAGEPQPALSPEVIRATLRRVQAAPRGVVGGELPRPGGGTFSRAVSVALAETVWSPRRSAGAPALPWNLSGPVTAPAAPP